MQRTRIQPVFCWRWDRTTEDCPFGTASPPGLSLARTRLRTNGIQGFLVLIFSFCFSGEKAKAVYFLFTATRPFSGSGRHQAFAQWYQLHAEQVSYAGMTNLRVPAVGHVLSSYILPFCPKAQAAKFFDIPYLPPWARTWDFCYSLPALPGQDLEFIFQINHLC